MLAAPRSIRGQDSVTVSTSESGSDAILKERLAGGSIKIPTGSSITSLTFYGAFQGTDTFFKILDADGAVLQRTVAAERIIPLPTECYGIPILKLVGDSSGEVDVFLLS